MLSAQADASKEPQYSHQDSLIQSLWIGIRGKFSHKVQGVLDTIA